MTHRTKHLETLGLIERAKGGDDRRNVVCNVTEHGHKCVAELCEGTCENIGAGQALSRVTPDRMRRYVDAMGSVSCMAGELIMLGLLMSDDGTATVTDLVERLGLLQPTVSMSVSSLVEDGLLERLQQDGGVRLAKVRLTDRGSELVKDLVSQIEALVVRRGSRTH